VNFIIDIIYEITSAELAMKCCLQAFIIAFTSQFIDRLVYEWHYSDTGTLEGFVNNSLSYFSVSDFSAGEAPDVDIIKPEHSGTTVCRYAHSTSTAAYVVMDIFHKNLG